MCPPPVLIGLKRASYLYIFGIQCDFMKKSCWKHSNFKNCSIRYINLVGFPNWHVSGCHCTSRSKWVRELDFMNLAPDLRNHQNSPKTDHSIAIAEMFCICYILPYIFWILMSRRFRICMASTLLQYHYLMSHFVYWFWVLKTGPVCLMGQHCVAFKKEHSPIHFWED